MLLAILLPTIIISSILLLGGAYQFYHTYHNWNLAQGKLIWLVHYQELPDGSLTRDEGVVEIVSSTPWYLTFKRHDNTHTIPNGFIIQWQYWNEEDHIARGYSILEWNRILSTDIIHRISTPPPAYIV
jgi:hypothetical protein